MGLLGFSREEPIGEKRRDLKERAYTIVGVSKFKIWQVQDENSGRILRLKS
jgi:hypothetical protein